MADQPSQRGALIFVLLAVFIDTLGFGIIMPIMPEFLSTLTGQNVSSAARDAGLLAATFAIFQFLCGPLMGNLSDRFGRRPVLLLSMAAFGVNYFLMALAPNLAWLFVGRAIAGVAGAIFAPANAYMADITPPADRAKRFALVGAAFGVGFVVGPALGGLIAAATSDVRAPFYAAALLACANAAFGFFALPESLPKDKRRAFSLTRANPLGALISLRRHGGVLALVGAIFFLNLAFHVYPTTWAFYSTMQFSWTPGEIGVSLAFVGAIMALVQGGLIGRLVRALGERRTAYIGFASSIGGMLAYAFANEGWIAYAITVAAGLQGVAGPSLNALASQSTPPEEQGELQGGIASANGLGAVVAPIALSYVFAWATAESMATPFPGAAFLLAATFNLIGLGLFALGARRTMTAPH